MKTLKLVIGIVSLLLLVMTSCEFMKPDNHESVDLGLSVEWATCNIGADYPEEYGDYFAWGERYSGNGYWDSYKWETTEGGVSYYTKYCRDGIYADNKIFLDLYDDAAYAKWGSRWRMPTKDEIVELVVKCKWSHIMQNGVKGFKVVGPNGHSIFFPASGMLLDGERSSVGTEGYYWSSSLNGESDISAYVLYINAEEVRCGNVNRAIALPIRPVRK